MNLQRNTSLDGLRGIAILMVVMHHATMNMGHHWAPVSVVLDILKAGWLGVEVFFALSGFLITGILLDKKENAAPKFFRSFYLRRALRIFPLYFGVLAVFTAIVAGTDWVGKEAHDRYFELLPWIILHSSNIAREYFVGPVLEFEWFELTHFWTLAVEEHFYFMWPLIIYWVKPRILPWVAAMIVVGSWLMQVLAVGENDPLLRGVLSTPKHLYGLALGSFAAIIMRRGLEINHLAGWAKWTIVAASAAFCSVLVFDFSVQAGIEKPFMGLFAALAAASTSLYVTIGQRGIVANLLSTRLLRFFGKYSYGIYIFHYLPGPWMRSLDLNDFPAGYTVGAFFYILAYLTVPTAIAVVSFRFWEEPWLKLKGRWQ